MAARGKPGKLRRRKTKLPAIKPVKGAAIFSAAVYSIVLLAQRLQVSPTMLRRLCMQGLLPGAKNHPMLGWIIDRRGALFAAQWIPKQEQLGSFWNEIVGRHAAQADPACVPRQQQYQPAGKVSAETLLEILDRRAKGETLGELAKQFDLDQSTISKLDSGQRRGFGRADRDELREYLKNSPRISDN